MKSANVVSYLFVSIIFYFGISLNVKAMEHQGGIAWHSGSIEEAFQKAKKTNKNLFLYWGAKWCPPCNLLKKNIFPEKAFQTALDNFIPIYLDGDTEKAQVWGQKLKALSYPTLLILNSEKKELMRLPTDGNLETYVTLLNSFSSKKANRSLKTLVKEYRKKIFPKNQNQKDKEWNILAQYSWSQDEGNLLPQGQEITLLKELTLASEQAALTIHYRLLMHLLEQSLDQDEIVPLLKEVESEKADKKTTQNLNLITKLHQIFSDHNLFKQHLSPLSYLMPKLLPLLEVHAKQVGNWPELVEKVAGQCFITTERLEIQLGCAQALVSAKQFPAGSKKKVDRSLSTKLLELVSKTDKEATTPSARQSLMNDAIYLLVSAGLFEDAKTWTEKEITKAPEPYYFMSTLSDIEEESANFQSAIMWSQKAYEQSSGTNTKFQWGVMMLETEGRLHSKEKDGLNNGLIASNQLKILVSDVIKDPGAFSGRNKRRFQRLIKNIAPWLKTTLPAENWTTLQNDLNSLCKASNLKKPCLDWVHNFNEAKAL